VLIAVAAGLAVANIYYAHPLLDGIGESLGLAPAATGVVVTATQVGYGVGLLAIVPLGDVLDRRRLIVTQLLLSAVALAMVGVARSPVMLLAGLTAVGLLAVVAQVLVAYAASLAPPHERGRVVGAVTSGIVAGIVFSRTFAGFVAELAGWRAVYLASAALTMALVAALVRGLPREERRNERIAYRRLLASTLALFRSSRALRVRGALALLTFAAFSALWASLALELGTSLTHGQIGMLGLAGAAGALAAAGAGRLADRGRGRHTTTVALTLMLVAWIPLAHPEPLFAFVAGLVLVEAALQAVHVTNQSIIYATDPESRSRLAGAYMVFYAIGSAAGAIASTVTYVWAGWTGVCALGAAISASALVVAVRGRVRLVGDPRERTSSAASVAWRIASRILRPNPPRETSGVNRRRRCRGRRLGLCVRIRPQRQLVGDERVDRRRPAEVPGHQAVDDQDPAAELGQERHGVARIHDVRETEHEVGRRQ